jgi:IS30 family transposase
MHLRYHQLTYDERCQIRVLISTGLSIRGIARQLNRSAATISREIKRNAVNQSYCHIQANTEAQARRAAIACLPRKMTPDLIDIIIESLKRSHSPEQISGRLMRQRNIAISHEAIYRMIWRDKARGGLLYQYLRRRGKQYHSRAYKTAGRGLIPDRVDISERPMIVESKQRIGDIEVDTMVGSHHRGALVTMVDRKSKLTFIRRVPNKTAAEVTRAMVQCLSKIKSHAKTITSDNGKEFAFHKKYAKSLGIDAFFAKPYRSYERGLNEHTNGLIRQYFPKGTNFQLVTDEEVAIVEAALNNRPRKVLDYATPYEVFLSCTGVALGC